MQSNQAQREIDAGPDIRISNGEQSPDSDGSLQTPSSRGFLGGLGQGRVSYTISWMIEAGSRIPALIWLDVSSITFERRVRGEARRISLEHLK